MSLHLPAGVFGVMVLAIETEPFVDLQIMQPVIQWHTL
jgi:hypothetical protein